MLATTSSVSASVGRDLATPSDRSPAGEPGPGPTGRPRAEREPPSRRLLRRAWPSLVPAVVLSLVYGATVQRSTGNAFSLDTTKFEFVGRVLGTPHPPGYPLYTLLNALAVRVVPFGSDALRVNLLSAVFAVLTCVVAVRVLRELGLSPGLAAGGATALGLLPGLWRNAVVAEVYSFSALFMVATLACVLTFERTRQPWWLRAGLLVFALSFAHATSHVLLIPGLVLYLLLRRPWWLLRPREWVTLLPAGALMALLPYAYLPWRTAAGGSWVETQVFDRHSFWGAITGAQFGDRMYEIPLRLALEQRLPTLAAAAFGQLGPLLVLCVVGLVVLARQRPLVALLTSAWALVTAHFLLTYLVGDWLTLLLPLWLVLALWTLVGLGWCVRLAPVRRRRTVAAAVAVALPLTALVTGYRDANRRGPDPQLAVDAAVADVPDGSMVFTPSLESRQQFVYRLLPGDLGSSRSVYAAEGSNHSRAGDAAVFHLREYCTDRPGPWFWPWHEQLATPTVPRGLQTFVFDAGYADQVQALGYRTTHVRGQLYAVRCAEQAAPNADLRRPSAPR